MLKGNIIVYFNQNWYLYSSQNVTCFVFYFGNPNSSDHSKIKYQWNINIQRESQPILFNNTDYLFLILLNFSIQKIFSNLTNSNDK